MFQFYLSSIKSKRRREIEMETLSFNSTLVQLKEQPTQVTDRQQACFNSTLVQLKGK